MAYFIIKTRYSRVDELSALSSTTTVTAFSRLWTVLLPRKGHDTNQPRLGYAQLILPSSLHLAAPHKKKS
jgi:hypothetical protein